MSGFKDTRSNLVIVLYHSMQTLPTGHWFLSRSFIGWLQAQIRNSNEVPAIHEYLLSLV